MSDRLVRHLLESRLQTWASARIPALPIAWENLPFTPPAGLYLRAFLLRGDTTSQDLAGVMRNRIGVFQVSITDQAASGPGASEGVAEEIDALYPVNLRLTSGAFAVQLTSPLRVRPAIQYDDRYLLPVDFQWRADEA